MNPPPLVPSILIAAWEAKGPWAITWVSIPSGSFQMGCEPQDTHCYGNESSRHSVSVPAFKMTATEVTQAQYQAVMGSNPSYFQPASDGGYAACPDCPVAPICKRGSIMSSRLAIEESVYGVVLSGCDEDGSRFYYSRFLVGDL